MTHVIIYFTGQCYRLLVSYAMDFQVRLYIVYIRTFISNRSIYGANEF